MSRSRRKTPIFGHTTARSDKPFKRDEHRRERRKVRSLLKDGKEEMPHRRKYGDEWNSPKDGKAWLKFNLHLLEKYMRK